jgi:hypothetical protein
MVRLKKVELIGNFYHAVFRDKSQFGPKGKRIFRTPDWAERVADSVVVGGEVVLGVTPSGSWLIQKILIPRNVGNARMAGMLARRIANKIERRR